MSTWKTPESRGWSFTERLITGYGAGIGEFGSSYALDTGTGPLLNGRISANLRLIRNRGVGAGLVCRADDSWNFVAFYTAPEEADSPATFARFGVYNEGALTSVVNLDEPIVLGTGYNRFSLEFFSGQLRGEIKTKDGHYELLTTCVAQPFPGHAGLLRLYGTGLMATDVIVQRTTIPLTQEAVAAEPVATQYDFDVFLCHSGTDKDLVRLIAKAFAANDIRYWLDEEQLTYGDGVATKIADGLQRTRYVVPCISANLAKSGWARAEYNAILNAEFSGDTARIVIPLVLDESDAENVPILLRDKKRAFYANKTEFEHFLRFLTQRTPA
ncbi:toll/interleukin-1 receptor domain-containing protein [Sphaerisporangium sp. B11E5]|uniref:toll/interleukin-1 receptor domain-containing protein n=1 Tax=Sphaerisporangium sp. B11E5 TaxID=3153563 RepID=UPI00325E1DFC